MTELYRPKQGERWASKTDPRKVLIVDWTNSCDYVSFKAPWMTRQRGCALDTFHKRYERVSTNPMNHSNTMTEKESQTDEQITEHAMFRWATSSEKAFLCQIILDACRQSRAEGVESQEDAIQRLRGQLQNCVDHLQHCNRKRPWSQLDGVIESANRALYEARNGATNDTGQ